MIAYQNLKVYLRALGFLRYRSLFMVPLCLTVYSLVMSVLYFTEANSGTDFTSSSVPLVRVRSIHVNELTPTNMHYINTATTYLRKIAMNVNTPLQKTYKVRPIKTKTNYPLTLEAPYLLNNPNFCKSVVDLSCLIIVHSAPIHYEKRNFMRKVWGNSAWTRDLGTVRILFLLGRPKHESVQTSLDREFEDYGDILQGDFVDAYRNLTQKGVMGLRWITENCKHAQLVIKMDDDVMINMYDLLTEYIPKNRHRNRTLYCNYIQAGTMGIMRDPRSKWYVKDSEFKGFNLYPQYCSGFAVFISADLVPALYKAAYFTPFFWVDDVYLFGLLPAKLKHVQYIPFRGKFTLNVDKALQCYTNMTKSCEFLVVGSNKKTSLTNVWKAMTNAYRRQAMKRIKTLHLSGKGSSIASYSRNRLRNGLRSDIREWREGYKVRRPFDGTNITMANRIRPFDKKRTPYIHHKSGLQTTTLESWPTKDYS